MIKVSRFSSKKAILSGMTTLIRTHCSLLASACLVLGLLTGCSSAPPAKPVKQASPFSLVPVNLLRTGKAVRLAASSSHTLVLASDKGDDWTAYELPSLVRKSSGHLATIRALAIHPAEEGFLTLSDGGKITLVSLADGREAPLVQPGLPTGRLRAAAIASDTSRAIACPPWGAARLFDLENARHTPLHLPGPAVRFISIAPDGSIVTGAGQSGSARFYPAEGQPTTIPLSGALTSAAWRRDYVACGSLFWEVRIWPRAQEAKAIVRTIDHTPVSALAFGEIENRVFIFAGGGRVAGGRILAWELPECQRELVNLAPQCEEIIYLGVHGTTLVAVSKDGMAGLWKIRPGSKISSTNTNSTAGS